MLVVNREADVPGRELHWPASSQSSCWWCGNRPSATVRPWQAGRARELETS